jgi:hypothetical protein
MLRHKKIRLEAEESVRTRPRSKRSCRAGVSQWSHRRTSTRVSHAPRVMAIERIVLPAIGEIPAIGENSLHSQPPVRGVVGEMGMFRQQRLQAGFIESHAAATKHTVITMERAIGRIKRYLQLTTVMAAKQRANIHAVPRISARASAGRPPSCHANIAANR